MHFWQAIKMAGKSLWSNKLRSFLTMLGIIIGVVTVSLLTSVAQGVSNAVVSSIRSQSTLAVMMNMTRRMTMKDANKIILDARPEDENADDYFEYSLIYGTRSIVANESKDIVLEDGISNSVALKKQYTLADFPNYDSMTPEEQGFVQLLIRPAKHNYVLSSNIYAVDNNFSKVYELELDGRYFEKSDEILVDREFIQTYFGRDITNEDALTREVTMGIENFSQIKIQFNGEVTEQTVQELVQYLTTSYELEDGTSIKFDVIKNSDGSLYTYNEETKILVLNIEMFSYLSNEELSQIIKYIPQARNAEVSVDDVFDLSKARTYKIVGIIADNSVSIMSSMGSSNSSEENSAESSIMMTYMSSLSSSSGTCYMLYDADNAKTFGEKDVENSTISYAYFRYKSEDNMSSSTTNLVMSFASAGYGYMSEFMLISFSSVANIMSNIMNILTIMLTVISVISLIVGGIGIMNIMLVAVTERTREIGIRKAIGAKKSSILVQFLVEALMLSIIGGLIGLGISAIGILIISNVMGVSLTIPAWVIAMSVGFCTAIGLIFGMFPAVKASNMQPIDALRRD